MASTDLGRSRKHNYETDRKRTNIAAGKNILT